MNEEAVRVALAGFLDDGGRPLLAGGDIAQVAVEGGWACVVIGREGVSADFLRRVHGHLAAAFAEASIEVRGGARIERGGAGFGAGRHVVAVLGGKGGVGKSTVSVNLALTLSALGLPAGVLDADLNAPDIPHMLGVHPKAGPRGPGFRLATPKRAPRA
jgi:hypothetical protein